MELPPAFAAALHDGEVEIEVPPDAAIPGDDYKLKVHDCEQIGERYLLHLEVGDRYLFLLSDEPVKKNADYAFSLRNDRLEIKSLGDVVISPVAQEVPLIGDFKKFEHREEGERVIDFYYGINEANILAPRKNGFRLNAVEGNKCYRNQYRYVVPVEKISLGEPIVVEASQEAPKKKKGPIEASAGINGVVAEKLDYGNIVYAKIKLGDQEALAIVDRDFNQENVSVCFAGEDVAVYNIDIDMRIC